MFGVKGFGQMSGLVLHTDKEIYLHICSYLHRFVHYIWFGMRGFGRTMSGPGLEDKDSLLRRLEIMPWPGF